MNKLTRLMFVLVWVGLCPLASADFIVYGTHTDHPLIPGGSLDDIRMSVSLSVDGGVATMQLQNVSAGLEDSVIFKEIVIDTWDNDTSTAILWNPQVVSDGWKSGNSNGLPGYNAQTKENPKLLELSSKNGKNRGLAIGETLVLTFSTALPDGSDIYDYFNAFGDGDDTGAYTLGFHGISSSTLNYESLSGINAHIPEPSTIAFLLIGASGIIATKRPKAEKV